MTMRFLESWAGHTDIAQRFDNVPTSLLPSIVLSIFDVENVIAPPAWCLEVGINAIGTQAKQVSPTDELVVGFQYAWDNSDSPSIDHSVDIEFEESDFTNITKLNIKSAGVNMAGGTALHGEGAGIGSAFFEVRVKQHPTLGTIEVWVNGVSVLSLTNLALGSAKIEHIRFGTDFQNPSKEQFSHIFLEDVQGEGAYTPRAQWYISKVNGASINFNVGFTNATGILGDGVATAGEVGARLIANAPGDTVGSTTVEAVQLSHTLLKTGTELVEYRLSMTMNGTEVTTTPVTIGSLAIHAFTQIMDEDPSDQTPLSEADVATLIGGVEITNRG